MKRELADSPIDPSRNELSQSKSQPEVKDKEKLDMQSKLPATTLVKMQKEFSFNKKI